MCNLEIYVTCALEIDSNNNNLQCFCHMSEVKKCNEIISIHDGTNMKSDQVAHEYYSFLSHNICTHAKIAWEHKQNNANRLVNNGRSYYTNNTLPVDYRNNLRSPKCIEDPGNTTLSKLVCSPSVAIEPNKCNQVIRYTWYF